MLNDSIEPTPRSMKTSGIWSKEERQKAVKQLIGHSSLRKNVSACLNVGFLKRTNILKQFIKILTIYTKIKIC